MNIKKGIYVVGVLLGIGISFLLGMLYQLQKEKARSFGQFDHIQGGMRGQQFTRNRVGLRPINGKIINLDDKSFTVKLEDESSKIVLFSKNTTFIKAEKASKSELKIGERVMVMGTVNTDGSVVAQNIQLNPPLQPRMQQ